MAPASELAHRSIGALPQVLRKLPGLQLWKWLGVVFVGGTAGAMLFMRRLLERMFCSISPLPPTKRQLQDEDLGANPLFRALPSMRGRLAWRQLGENFPTPVHRLSCDLSSKKEVEFWVKREDLCSARYGGNKVRTLQYQLASCEAIAEQSGREAAFLVMGSGGSNQVLATKVHAAYLDLPADSILGLTPLPDEKEMDNTLNMLSSMSVPGKQGAPGKGFSDILAALGFLPWSNRSGRVFMPGGHSPLGVLGQVGGALELAEQVVKGELPDPDGIVVAMGSMCTTTGIVVGVALARFLGMQAFQTPGFRVHAQPVHPAICMMHKLFGAVTSETWPPFMGRSIKEVCSVIVAHGGPDITAESLAVMRNELVISLDMGIAGKYGCHSESSRAAQVAYDRFAKLPSGASHLWLCGHFTAKSFALLLKLLEGEGRQGSRKRFLFWQTKSAVQPQGPVDEWSSFTAAQSTSSALKAWGVVGGITGHPSFVAREGFAGSEKVVEEPDDYKSLLTTVSFPTPP
eukprot:TRINITY_DN25896_c0_g1_i1.p1 TRINITY_DN25896_c0_g1~~TRINITY_DN25896_c0_g1_i1.p1  ORF type:complete len:516 (+),score=107.33 TRINITY_DN25896_c0_g1_i1:45-1592(+)